jgi:hypothetical protein
MIAWTIRCPVCTNRHCRRSQSGWLRYLTRPFFVFPLRCRHCQTRFWRLTFYPPPPGRPKKRESGAVPPHPAAPNSDAPSSEGSPLIPRADVS